jgi:hypothetical protein
MLYTKDVNYYMDYLKEQDGKMCRKIHGRKPTLFYKIGFITFNNTNNPKCNTMTPRYARGKNIFDMIGRHGALLPALLHATNTQHAAQQKRVVKTREYYWFYYSI